MIMLEMRITNFDLAMGFEQPIICGLTDGRMALLRPAHLTAGMLEGNLAHRRAVQERLLILELTEEILRTVIYGKSAPIIACPGGQTGESNIEVVVLRLATADEFMEMHRRSCAEVGVEPTLTREKAEELTHHL